MVGERGSLRATRGLPVQILRRTSSGNVIRTILSTRPVRFEGHAGTGNVHGTTDSALEVLDRGDLARFRRHGPPDLRRTLGCASAGRGRGTRGAVGTRAPPRADQKHAPAHWHFPVARAHGLPPPRRWTQDPARGAA